MKLAPLVCVTMAFCMTICAVTAMNQAGNVILPQKVLQTQVDSGLIVPGVNAVDPLHCNTRKLSFDSDASLQIENWNFMYDITGIASEPVKEITVTPRIVRVSEDDDSEDVTVFEGSIITCNDVSVCSATGSFSPEKDVKNVTGSFYATGYVLFTPYEDECAPDDNS